MTSKRPVYDESCDPWPENLVRGLDPWPGAYARWRASEVGVITDALEDQLLFDLIGEPWGLDILDVGCGDGAISLALSQQGAHVIGIDPSLAMIEAARERAASAGAKASFCLGKAERLPFPNEQFDLVVAKTILCFVEDPTDMFAEIARVLRPGGRLVIGELGKWSTWALQRTIRGWLGSPLWAHGHFWTASDLRSLARKAGLDPAEMRGAIFYPRLPLAARLLRRWDDTLGRITTIGGAFLAMSAKK